VVVEPKKEKKEMPEKRVIEKERKVLIQILRQFAVLLCFLL